MALTDDDSIQNYFVPSIFFGLGHVTCSDQYIGEQE